MLASEDREEISRGIAVDLTGKQIACRIGRCESIVSLEIARHGSQERYRATRVTRVPQAGRRSGAAADRGRSAPAKLVV
jgi:transposase, IS30 family